MCTGFSLTGCGLNKTKQKTIEAIVKMCSHGLLVAFKLALGRHQVGETIRLGVSFFCVACKGILLPQMEVEGAMGMPVGGGGVFGDLCGWVAVLGRTLSADLLG